MHYNYKLKFATLKYDVMRSGSAVNEPTQPQLSFSIDFSAPNDSANHAQISPW